VPDFQTTIAAFIADHFRLDPLSATAAGNHDHDGRWPDMTEAGRRARLDAVERWEQAFRGIQAGSLSPDDAVDRDLLLLELDAERFFETELREETWSPLLWVYLLGGGLFPLIARDFAPLPVRLRSAAERLEGIPAVLAAARESLDPGTPRPLPVDRLHTETAIKQLSGVTDLIDDVATAADAGVADPEVAGLLDRIRAAAAAATASVGAFGAHLRDDVLPRSEGDGRVGSALFAAKMRHTMRSEALTPDRILAAAEMEFDAVRAELVRLAREHWSRYLGSAAPPDGEGALVRAVVDAIAVEHPAAEELLDFCREELQRIEGFCRERNVIGLAEEPLDIRWTPVFMRSFGGAMLDSPGPLDRGQQAFFSITPIPDDWSAEQAESYLREMNARQLRLLTIHEAVPGHYLQGVYANRSSSMVRGVFRSGLFAEGWAVYVTQVMMDLGYGADDPGVIINHWKYYLRAITNAIIDARIHTAGMTESEAVSLMVDGAFQEEAEARAKYNRARLSSTQLSTYFTGSFEFWEIEREARRRAAAASGDPGDADAVPEPRVVGGYPPTPGFDYRAHLEACLSHGMPPTSLLRRILLD
jgi:uncharacterized protein (DUF885 family)